MGGSGPATDSSPWDANAAMSSAKTAADYNAICAGKKAGDPALRSSHALPHHKRPGSPANAGGVRAARSRFDQTEGLMNKEAARTHIFESHSLPSEREEAEAATGITFVDDEQVAASFTADVERRIIGGIVVPWGKIARSGFAKWRFAKGSLRWADTKRIKLNLNHDHKQAIGYAARLHNTIDGLEATFKVARGEDGDRALALAEDSVLDGFSIEVDFDDGDEWQPDPHDEHVRLVTRGRLAGVALTGFPAFDDARADRVAAARQNGGQMAEETGAVELDSDQATATFQTAMERLAGSVVENQNKLTENLSQSIAESVSAGIKASLEEIGTPQERGSVKAARYTVTREEPVYRFNGTGDCLVRDAWYAATAKDENAIERLRKYRAQTEDVARLFTDQFFGGALPNAESLQFAPQTTSTAAQVIPPGYRPDLYVGELLRGRPFVQAASRGVIENATPFTVPVFSSSSGGAADHVEGTNPSDGSLSFATRTVTPQAVSGRMVLSREIVDSSNPAIDQIAMATMREDYARDTEAKVYTLLNGASGAGGTITSGFVPSGAQASTTAGGTDNQTLVKHIRTRLADYGFSRFQSPDVALMGQGATGRLAAAVDTAQRPLFPWVGPQNAFGQGPATQGSWVIDGVPFVAAWAATGVAAGDTQIFILNRSDLWVWESPLLSFRFEEKQGPANIELNIFGYFATHLLRPVGLSGIRIT